MEQKKFWGSGTSSRAQLGFGLGTGGKKRIGPDVVGIGGGRGRRGHGHSDRIEARKGVTLGWLSHANAMAVSIARLAARNWKKHSLLSLFIICTIQHVE